MQTSHVFSQRAWPGHDPRPGSGGPDIDDCAVVATIQAVNVTSPWLKLVGTTAFRRAAGNPDDPNAPDGLTEAQVVAGIIGCWPVLRGHLTRMRGESWTNFVRIAEAGHPITVAIDSSKLPEPLRFGFTGRHRVALAYRNGQLLYANPLARVYSRWLRIDWDDVRAAVMSFGTIMTGNRGAWAVALPTDLEALALLRDWTDDTPYDESDLDAATAELQARIDAAKEALGG